MKQTTDVRFLAEAYSTQRTKQMMIEQIVQAVQNNPKLLDEGLWDSIKSGLSTGLGAVSNVGGPWGAAAGAASNLLKPGATKNLGTALGSAVGGAANSVTPGGNAISSLMGGGEGSGIGGLLGKVTGGAAPSAGASGAAPSAGAPDMNQLVTFLKTLQPDQLKSIMSQLSIA